MNVWSTKVWQIPCKWEVEVPKCGKHNCKYHAEWKAHMTKCSKYHAKCKVTMPKCSKYNAKWQVLVPDCCKYLANGTRKERPNKSKTWGTKKQQKLFYTVIRNWFKRIFKGFASVIRIYRVRKHMETSFPVLISLEQNPMNFRVPLQHCRTMTPHAKCCVEPSPKARVDGRFSHQW